MTPDSNAVTDDIEYPDSDGQPMADNTLQWDWMVKVVGELREQYAGQRVFVGGDLLWYPVKGSNTIRTAPDALVAFGRPPGYRGSYKQWAEDGIAPQVVFEVLSPNNTREEMARKLLWYDRYGVEEYYLIDPDRSQVYGWVREGERLLAVVPMDGFVSPRLGVRFEVNGEVVLYTPAGHPFRTREERTAELIDELRQSAEELRKTAEAFEQVREWAIEAERDAIAEAERADAAVEAAEAEKARADDEKAKAEAERVRADAEAERANRSDRERTALLAKLRELGLDPDEVLKPTG